MQLLVCFFDKLLYLHVESLIEILKKTLLYCNQKSMVFFIM